MITSVPKSPNFTSLVYWSQFWFAEDIIQLQIEKIQAFNKQFKKQEF